MGLPYVLYLLMASLIASPFLDLASHKKGLWKLSHAFTLACSLACLALMAYSYGASGGTWPRVASYGELGVGTCLLLDRASLFMASTALLLSALASTYALGEGPISPGYCVAFTALMAGMVGVSFSGDLLTLYVFWEVMCLAAYALVAMGELREEALEAAWKYFIMASAGAILMLFGASLTYGLAGTLNMPLLARRLEGASDRWLYVALLFFLVGMGVEAALFPLYTWLPDAHSAAPTPISTMLSGVVIEIGFYALAKVMLVLFGQSAFLWQATLASLCVANMLVGSLSALVQRDVKRLLAYSSVANMGYLMAALASYNVSALSAAFFFVLSHALSKGLAFLCAGHMATRTGSRELGALRDVRAGMPLTTALLFLSLLSLAGLPGTCGFVAKLVLISALFSTACWWLGILALLNAILMAAAYIRAIWSMLGPPAKSVPRSGGEGRLSLTAMALMALLIVVLGFWPSPALRLAHLGARDLLGVR